MALADLKLKATVLAIRGYMWWMDVKQWSQKHMLWKRLKQLSALSAIVFGTTVGSAIYLYMFRPKALVLAIIAWGRRKSGMMTKYISDTSGFKFSYAERGSPKPGQPTMVLVPGLGGTIDNWTSVVRHMSTRHHIIAVEMPGGGKTTCDSERDLNILAQVERLQQFLELMKLSSHSLHLVGAATGGTIVGCYAAMHPEHVTKLTLICPAMRSPIDSDVIRMELSGQDSGLVPKSSDALQRSLALLVQNPKKLSKQMRKGIFEVRKHNVGNMTKLSESMLDEIWRGSEDRLLTPRIEKITAPTQIIWGQYDRVVHVSAIDVLRSHLPNCVSVHVLPTGHSIYMEQPRQLAALLQQFAFSASRLR